MDVNLFELTVTVPRLYMHVGGDVSEPISQRKPWILIEDSLTKQVEEEK